MNELLKCEKDHEQVLISNDNFVQSCASLCKLVQACAGHVFSPNLMCMEDYHEIDQVRQCLKLIEEKLTWGGSAEWHNEMFSELSTKIHLETEVLLSPTTLKRVWGRVQYNNAPSITTLNALAQFAGFDNWRAFKVEAKHTAKSSKPRKPIRNLGVIVASAALLTVVFISFFSMSDRPQAQLSDRDLSKIEFTSKAVADDLPNSVIFNVDLAGYDSDSMYIQQDWDVRRRIKLNTGQRQATGIYYIPGYFEAKLLLEGNVVRAHDLFIKSHGWIATIDYSPVPKYLKSSEILSDKLILPNEIIDEISKSEEPINSTYHFVADFGDVSGDNFSLIASIKNSYREKWAVCQTTKIVILGTTGVHIIPFSLPGCVSDINLLLHDNYLSGKENDLSAFGVDFTTTRDIGVSIENKNVVISVDGIEVYHDKYNDAIGRLVGLRFRATGAIEIQALNVRSAQGTIDKLMIGK